MKVIPEGHAHEAKELLWHFVVWKVWWVRGLILQPGNPLMKYTREVKTDLGFIVICSPLSLWAVNPNSGYEFSLDLSMAAWSAQEDLLQYSPEVFDVRDCRLTPMIFREEVSQCIHRSDKPLSVRLSQPNRIFPDTMRRMAFKLPICLTNQRVWQKLAAAWRRLSL